MSRLILDSEAVTGLARRDKRLCPAVTGAGYRPKLIAVALPLAAINREAAREKSIRHGHPSTLHLWWRTAPRGGVGYICGAFADDIQDDYLADLDRVEG